MLGACVFPIGLFLVVTIGVELFTGNCFIFIPVLSGKAKFTGMLRNWVLVYLGNMVGGFFSIKAAYQEFACPEKGHIH